MSLDQLTQAAIALPEDQRRSLCNALRDTLPPEEYLGDDIDYDAPGAPRPHTDEQIHAIAVQRLEDYDAGRAGSISLEEFEREMRERLK